MLEIVLFELYANEVSITSRRLLPFAVAAPSLGGVHGTELIHFFLFKVEIELNGQTRVHNTENIELVGKKKLARKILRSWPKISLNFVFSNNKKKKPSVNFWMFSPSR